MLAVRSLTLASLALATPLALAHHSPAAYDSAAEVRVTGTVTKFEWANPHAYVSVMERTASGAERAWLVELVSPSVLKQFGWSPTTLAAGDSVTFTGMPGRNRGRNIAYLLLLEKSDDVVLDMRGMAPGRSAPAGLPSAAAPSASFTATSIAGTWATLFGPGFGQLLGNAAALPVTPKGALAMREFTDTVNPGRDCVQFAAPLYMVLPFFRRIEIGGDTVVIRGEEGDVVRTVDMSRRTHDGAVASLHGDSIGRWDGAALVVDTSHFAEHRLGNAAGLPSGAMKRLVERFELAPGGNSLTYTFVLEDPEHLSEPVQGRSTWAYRPDVEYAPLACNVDNARRFLEE